MIKLITIFQHCIELLVDITAQNRCFLIKKLKVLNGNEG
jgi:hypothetical protein